MDDDVVSAYRRGFAAFVQSRAEALVEESLSEAGDLVESLLDGAAGATRARIEALKARVGEASDAITAFRGKLQPQIDAARDALARIGAEIGGADLGPDGFLRVLGELGRLLEAYDKSLEAAAEAAAAIPGDGLPAGDAEQIKADIKGLNAPLKRALRGFEDDLAEGFDRFCGFALGDPNASRKVGQAIRWDDAARRLSATLGGAGTVTHGPEQPDGPSLAFDGAGIEAYAQLAGDLSAGLTLTTRLRAGLGTDPFLRKIVPGRGGTADSDGMVSVTLDTAKGLVLGSGMDQRISLPVRAAPSGVDLRGLAVLRPPETEPGHGNRVDVVMTVAGRLGDGFAVVAEDLGLKIAWRSGAGPDIQVRPATGIGLRLGTPAVKGGGFLRHDEARGEFGGVLQLEMAKIGITAIGLLSPDPFNLVVVISLRFLPKIELGFGFTLNGLGGLLAIERSIDVTALAAGLKTDVVGQILFPADPVTAAPQILDRLDQIVPPRPGGIVVGPIAELGWGSQAGFLKARLGVVLNLPDPRLVILGAVQVGVPSTEVPPGLRLVDINANILGEITPDALFFKVALAPSRLFALTLTGELALLIEWGDGGLVAFSVGGFFPDYPAPPRIGQLERASIRFAPPVDWITVQVAAYFAVTSNSVQFGGRLDLGARIGPAEIAGWVQIDALLQWAPYFHFETRLDLGIRVKAFGTTLAGVQFRGTLTGDKPWRIEGRADCEILWWDVPIPVGPIQWGPSPPAPPPIVDLVDTVASALGTAQAWTPVLPPGAATLARLVERDGLELHHPLGEIEVRQHAVPLDTPIDRIGSARVSAPRVDVTGPRLGATEPGAVWPLAAPFPPGHFLDLTDDQVMSRPEFEMLPAGLGLAATKGPHVSEAVHAVEAWTTVYPRQQIGNDRHRWAFDALATVRLLDTNPVAAARSARGNPFLDPARLPAPPILADRGLLELRQVDSLAATPGVFTPSAAAVARALAPGDLVTLDAGTLA